ncbi:MAG: hypothetical protein WA125_17740 [Desulfosporosinus sp.]
MEYTSGPYTQGQLLKDINEIETSLTNRFLTNGVITDVVEQRSWRERVEDASFGRNTAMYDDLGNPSVMVAFPLQTRVDLGVGTLIRPHEAFIVNEVTKPAFYNSKYPNIVRGSGTTLRALSLKGMDPGNSINFDNAMLACKQKGPGWHLQTNPEWSAIALGAKKQGFLPRGNSLYGKDNAVASEKGIASYFSSNNIARTLTGSGPLAWSHDGTPFGVCDIKGNVSKWIGGMRLNNGEIQILVNNNAADNTNDQSATSVLWLAILATDGSLVETKWQASHAYPLNAYITQSGLMYKATTAGTSGAAAPVWPTVVSDTVTDGTVVWTCVADQSLKFDYTAAPTAGSASIELATTILNAQPDDTAYGTKLFETLTAHAGITVPDILKSLCLFPLDASHGGNRFYFRNNGERLPDRGGSWNSASNAGVFGLGLFTPRSASAASLGFFSAFVL